MMTIRQVIIFSYVTINNIKKSKIFHVFLFSGFGYIIILFDVSSSRDNYRYYWYSTSIWFGILTNIL